MTSAANTAPHQGGAVRYARGVLSGLFFLSYGFGSILLGSLVLPVLLLTGSHAGSRRAARLLLRLAYRLFVWAARWTGLFRVELTSADRARLASLHGTVIVSNHLTLIDIVILMALLPDTTAIAKAAAGRNFFYARIVQTLFLSNDDPLHILEEAKAALDSGLNVIVFPEGTRTPAATARRKLRRGAAQIACHAAAPVQPLFLTCDPPILAKGQAWYDVGDRTIVYTLACRGMIPAPTPVPGEGPHAAAVALTAAIYARLWS